MNNNMSSMTQSEMLLNAFRLVANSGLFPETPLKDWVAILLFLHKKGYLFVGFEEEELRVVACAYRVSKVPKEFPKNYPDKEKGTVLYIPWMVSIAKDKLLPKKLMNRYLKNNPKIKTISFHDHGKNDKIKIFKKQEARNGKK